MPTYHYFTEAPRPPQPPRRRAGLVIAGLTAAAVLLAAISALAPDKPAGSNEPDAVSACINALPLDLVRLDGRGPFREATPNNWLGTVFIKGDRGGGIFYCRAIYWPSTGKYTAEVDLRQERVW